MESGTPEYILHTYFRSTCSGRLRIALNLKGIPYTPAYVNLLRGEQTSAEYGEINPSRSVPTLQSAASSSPLRITQSIAALEYLEEKYPDRSPLLPPPSDHAGRAAVRTLVNIIASDTQPVTNLRILHRLGDLGVSKEQWNKDFHTAGLTAYERVAQQTSGKYSVGDSITLADVVLVPAVWGATRWGIDVDALPTINRVFEEMSKEDAVRKAHWANQDDTPEDLRHRSGEGYSRI